MILHAGINPCSLKRGMNQNRPDLAGVEKAVVHWVEQSTVKLTPQSLIEHVKTHHKRSSGQARALLKALIGKGELSYIHELGHTFIGLNFSKPVPISEHFTLSPPGLDHQSVPDDDSEDCTIYLEAGVSFGSGRHPTTQMCLAAIDDVVFNKNRRLRFPCHAADIGTGTGILALALCRATGSTCLAYDIDPVCRSQTRHNVKLNRLEDRIQVSTENFDQSGHPFDIIMANLRYPTLSQLAPVIREKTQTGGILILSGIREWEVDPLTLEFEQLGFIRIEHYCLKEWACTVFQLDQRLS